MTTATVFNAYTVVQRAGPTTAWMPDGDGKIQMGGGSGIGGTLFTFLFYPLPDLVVEGLAFVRLEVSSGDLFKVGVNGAGLVQFYNGNTTHDFDVAFTGQLQALSYEINNYNEPIRLTLLNASYSYPDLVPAFVPVWTNYKNTLERET